MSGQAHQTSFGSDPPNQVTDEQPPVTEPRAASPADKQTAHNPGQGRDQRSSFRCPIQPEHLVAVLASRRKRHAVRLLDRSAGGFCVAYTGPAQFKSGQVLRLLSTIGEHRVRVVYALRNKEDMHIGLADLGLVGPQSSSLGNGILFVIIVLATAALARFL